MPDPKETYDRPDAPEHSEARHLHASQASNRYAEDERVAPEGETPRASERRAAEHRTSERHAFEEAAPDSPKPSSFESRTSRESDYPYGEGSRRRESRSADRRQPFVRQRAPHLTQPPVNDVQVDEEIGRDYPHESSYTLSSRHPLGSRTYRRSRSNVSRVKQQLKYGQYLSVPKGNHEIFSSRDRVRRHQLTVAVVAAAIIVAVIVLFLVFAK